MASRLTPTLLVSFLGGIELRSFFDVPLKVSWLILGTALGILLAFKVLRHNANIVVLIILIFFLGIVRLSYFQKNIEQDNLHNFYGKTITLEGVVLESKFTQASQRVITETEQGKVLLVTKVFPEYKYGNVLKIFGEVKEPESFGNIDMKNILAKDRIYFEIIFPEIEKIGHSPPSKIMNFLFFIKEDFEKKLKSILPEPHSSLANGMILGSEGVLEKSIKESFQKSGTIHILVLSGYNITLVGAFLMGALSFLPRTLAFFGSVAGIILFTLMAGAEPPAVRAAIMGIIGLLVLRGGRVKTPMLLLFWSAFFMALWNPAILRFDKGFQLSFLATLGLISASPFFLKKLKFLPKFLNLRENATSSLSAQLFVIPLLLSWGNEVSYLSPLANVFIVGVVPWIMAFGFAGGVVSFVWEFLGGWIASVAYILISFQIYVAKFFAGFSQTFIKFNFLPLFVLCVFYALLLYWAAKKYLAEQ